MNYAHKPSTSVLISLGDLVNNHHHLHRMMHKQQIIQKALDVISEAKHTFSTKDSSPDDTPFKSSAIPISSAV